MRICKIIFLVLFVLSPVCLISQEPVKDDGFRQVKKVLYGLASYYADKFHGRQTATGDIFSQGKVTAACNVLPLGTWIRVTNLKNGKSLRVRTNDRLHPKTRRIIDLSHEAARQLDYIKQGLTRVKIEVLSNYTASTDK